MPCPGCSSQRAGQGSQQGERQEGHAELVLEPCPAAKLRSWPRRCPAKRPVKSMGGTKSISVLEKWGFGGGGGACFGLLPSL